jgi:hypothetical protein
MKQFPRLEVPTFDTKTYSQSEIRKVMTVFQVKQSLPPSLSVDLVGIHHKLVSRWCALEEWAS